MLSGTGRKSLLYSAIVATVIVSSGCRDPVPSPPGGLGIGTVKVGRSAGVAWLDQTRLAVSKASDPGDPASPIDLEIFSLPTRSWEPMNLPKVRDCQRTEYLGPQTLPDGRLGAIRRCFPLDLSADISHWLVAIDVESGAVTELTGNLGPANLTSYAWNHEMSSAVVSVGSRICHTIQRVDGDRLAPLDVTVTDGDQSFSLAEMSDPGATPCDNTGQADDPGSSPTEEVLAFSASVAAIGLAGPARLEAPFGLYVMRSANADPVLLVRDVSTPTSLEFSPSGECFAFGGSTADDGSGTYAVNPESGELSRLSELAVSPAWSPDGASIAGVVMTGGANNAEEWLVAFAAECAQGP